jgi:hypothetical protein
MNIRNEGSSELQVDDLFKKVLPQIVAIDRGWLLNPYEAGSCFQIKNSLIARICGHRIEMLKLAAYWQWRTVLRRPRRNSDTNLKARRAISQTSMSETLRSGGKNALMVCQNFDRETEWKKVLPERKIHITQQRALKLRKRRRCFQAGAFFNRQGCHGLTKEYERIVLELSKRCHRKLFLLSGRMTMTLR